MMVLVDEGFRGDEVINGIGVLLKEAGGSSIIRGDARRSRLGGGSSPDMESADTMILNFPTSRAAREKCVLFISHPIYGILL